MNTLPRQKIHATPADKAKAYRQRQALAKQASARLIKPLVESSNPQGVDLAEAWEELPEIEKEALRRLAFSQEAVTNLKNVAR